MVLSNAERQRRFREKRNAAAKGADLPERVRLAIEEAVRVYWAIMQRGNYGGWHEDMSSAEEAIAYLGTPEGAGRNPARDLIAMFSDLEEATPEEAAILDRAVAVIRSATLQSGSLG